MDRTEFLATAVGMARTGMGFVPSAALDCLAELVDEIDATRPAHDFHVEKLLRVAACIWSLRHDKYIPSLSRAASPDDCHDHA